MAENENGGGLTVPVQVGKRVDVSKQLLHSKKSVLFVNNKGQAHMVPEDMALNQVKSNRGHIVEKTHKEYMRLYKAAIGFDDKIGTKKFVQIAGKVSSIEDASRTSAEDMVLKETMESEKAKKDAGVK